MSDKIKLLELDIDFDNVIKRASDARQNLEHLKNETKEMKKVLEETNSRYKESEERLKSLEQQGKKNSAEYDLQKKVSDALRISVEKRNQSYEKSISQEREAQKQYRVSKTVLDAYNKELEDGIGIIVKTDGSINQLNSALATNRKVYRDLSEEQRNNEAIGGRLLKIINEQDKEYKDLNVDMGVTQVNVGNYTNSIVEALGKLKSGDIKGFSSDVKELGTTWIQTSKGISSAIMSMPLVGWLAAVAVGLGLVLKQVYDYNVKLNEANQLTASITKLQGDALDKATLRSKTLEEVLGLDRKETLESARALVQEFGITYEEALQRIEDGAIKGGAANQEYLDSIKEYPAFFAKAGFSANEFIDIINKGYDVGIFKDKLPDALKEFSLSITEQTKSSRSALVNAFGATFTDDLLKRVSEGKTTIKESLIEISKESEKYNLTQKQQAQLTADLFRGAGEDAGGFAKIMDVVTGSLVKHNSELNETQKFIKQVTDQTNELETAKLNAMKSDSVVAFKKEFELLWLKIQTGYYNFISSIRTADREFQASSQYMRGVFKSLPEAAAISFKGIIKSLATLVDGFKSGGSAISKFFKGDFDGAMAEADKFKNAIPNTFKDIKNTTANAWKTIGDSASKEANNYRTAYNNRQKALADVAIKEQENAAKNGTKPVNNFDGSEDAKKKAEAEATKKEAEAKKAAEKLQKIAEANAKAASDLMKFELDEYILKNKSRIENQTVVTANLLKLENDRLDTIQKKKLELLEEEKKAELSKKDLTEKEKQAIDKKFNLESLKLTDETAKEKKEIELKYAEQIKQNKEFAQLVEHQNRLRQIEQSGNDEFKLKREQLDYEYQSNQERKDIQKKLDDLSKQDQDDETLERKRLLEEALYNIDLEFQANKVAIAEESDNAKLQSYVNVATGIAQIVGKQSELGKIAAVAEIAIDKAKAISKIITAMNVANAVAIASSPLTFGQPMVSINTANGFKQIGTVVLQGGLAVAGILATNTNFSGLIGGIQGLTNKGGASGNKAERGILLKGNSHSRGGINLYDDAGNHVVEAEGDELLAVINKKSTGLLKNLSFINQLGGGIPLTHNVKYAASGGLVSSSTNINISKQIGSTIAEATHSGVQKGMKDLAEAAFTGIQEGMRGLSDDRSIMKDAKI